MTELAGLGGHIDIDAKAVDMEGSAPMSSSLARLGLLGCPSPLTERIRFPAAKKVSVATPVLQ